MLYRRIKKEHGHLQEQIRDLQKKMAVLPEGKLICSRGSDGFRWYISDGHTKTYIPKRNRGLAEQLAVKKYLSRRMEGLEQEKRALEFYLRHHSSLPEKAEQLLTDPGHQELLAHYIRPSSMEAREWMEASYESNRSHPERLIHKTVSGGLVRSKSESIISLFLHTHQIPFRYECALQLGEMTIYPDFTIRHPFTGKIYYWEHFGRMDDPGYAKNVGSKLQLYIAHGIIPSIQLITTYETMESPLDAETIEGVIQNYFL